MKSGTLATAEFAESKINKICEDYDDPYNLKFASVWTMTATGDMVCRFNNRDVYELLEDAKTAFTIKDSEFFVVLTCGWAAPISDTDDDTPPSQAKSRRRVRLAVCADELGVASVLRFSDTPDETMTDDGGAKGSLAEAVQQLYTNIKIVNKITKEMGE